MKFIVPHKTLIMLLLLLICFSCKESIQTVDLLVEAQKAVEPNPALALTLLDSISKPESMDKDNYMQYVVARVQAKYKLYQDVTNDTLIFEAQKYFDNKKNPNQAALANIYTGMVYREKDMTDEALRCYLQSIQDARQVGNNLLTARALHNISNVYFSQNIMDSSIVYSQKALNYYNKIEGTSLNKIELMNLIGNAYRRENKQDSALVYFSKGLYLAEEINDREYQATFKHVLGVVHNNMKHYDQAVIYFHQALEGTTNRADSLRAYLNLATSYIAKHQLDSARFYTDLMKEGLSDIVSIHTLSSTYGSLADYNKQSGNLKEAIYYMDLQKATDKKIADSNHADKLLTMDSKFKLSIKDMENRQVRLYLFVSTITLSLIFLLIISIIRTGSIRRKHRHEKEILEAKNKLLKAEYNAANQEIESLIFMQNNYQIIIHEWANIERKAERYIKKHMGKEIPEIHLLIKDMKEDIRQTTNRQLAEWAKTFLQKQPSGEKAIAALDDTQLVVLVLSYCRYSDKDIATILSIPLRQRNMNAHKLSIRYKLASANIPESLIDELLFGKDYSLEFQV